MYTNIVQSLEFSGSGNSLNWYFSDSGKRNKYTYIYKMCFFLNRLCLMCRSGFKVQGSVVSTVISPFSETGN